MKRFFRFGQGKQDKPLAADGGDGDTSATTDGANKSKTNGTVGRAATTSSSDEVTSPPANNKAAAKATTTNQSSDREDDDDLFASMTKKSTPATTTATESGGAGSKTPQPTRKAPEPPKPQRKAPPLPPGAAAAAATAAAETKTTENPAAYTDNYTDYSTANYYGTAADPAAAQQQEYQNYTQEEIDTYNQQQNYYAADATGSDPAAVATTISAGEGGGGLEQQQLYTEAELQAWKDYYLQYGYTYDDATGEWIPIPGFDATTAGDAAAGAAVNSAAAAVAADQQYYYDENNAAAGYDYAEQQVPTEEVAEIPIFHADTTEPHAESAHNLMADSLATASAAHNEAVASENDPKQDAHEHMITPATIGQEEAALEDASGYHEPEPKTPKTPATPTTPTDEPEQPSNSSFEVRIELTDPTDQPVPLREDDTGLLVPEQPLPLTNQNEESEKGEAALRAAVEQAAKETDNSLEHQAQSQQPSSAESWDASWGATATPAAANTDTAMYYSTGDTAYGGVTYDPSTGAAVDNSYSSYYDQQQQGGDESYYYAEQPQAEEYQQEAAASSSAKRGSTADDTTAESGEKAYGALYKTKQKTTEQMLKSMKPTRKKVINLITKGKYSSGQKRDIFDDIEQRMALEAGTHADELEHDERDKSGADGAIASSGTSAQFRAQQKMDASRKPDPQKVKHSEDWQAFQALMGKVEQTVTSTAANLGDHEMAEVAQHMREDIDNKQRALSRPSRPPPPPGSAAGSATAAAAAVASKENIPPPKNTVVAVEQLLAFGDDVSPTVDNPTDLAFAAAFSQSMHDDDAETVEEEKEIAERGSRGAQEFFANFDAGFKNDDAGEKTPTNVEKPHERKKSVTSAAADTVVEMAPAAAATAAETIDAGTTYGLDAESLAWYEQGYYYDETSAEWYYEPETARLHLEHYQQLHEQSVAAAAAATAASTSAAATHYAARQTVETFDSKGKAVAGKEFVVSTTQEDPFALPPGKEEEPKDPNDFDVVFGGGSVKIVAGSAAGGDAGDDPFAPKVAPTSRALVDFDGANLDAFLDPFSNKPAAAVQSRRESEIQPTGEELRFEDAFSPPSRSTTGILAAGGLKPRKSIDFDYDLYADPYEKGPLPVFSAPPPKDGWTVYLRWPPKKKLTQMRVWKKIHLRIAPDGSALWMFNSPLEPKPAQEMPLQGNYEVSDTSAQPFDDYGKIHTMKLEYVLYKERTGIRKGQLDRIAKVAATGDLSKLSKLGLPLEHAAQITTLAKFGMHNLAELRSLQEALENAIFHIPMERTRSMNYTQEEIQAYLQDEFKAHVDKMGLVTNRIGRVRVFCLAFCNGMSDIEFGLNDKKRHGLEVVGRKDILPVMTEEWIDIEQYEFHSCVQLDGFTRDHVVRFKPPDATLFELLRFRVRPVRARELPLSVRVVYAMQGYQVHIKCEAMASGFFKPQVDANGNSAEEPAPCKDIQIRIPVPEQWIYLFRVEKLFGYGSKHAGKQKFGGKIKGLDRLKQAAMGAGGPAPQESTPLECSTGMAKYEHVNRSIVWRVDKMPKAGKGAYTQHLLEVKLQLNPHDRMPDTFKPNAEVEYHMPITSASHTTLRSITVNPQVGDEPPEKWAKYRAYYNYTVEIEYELEAASASLLASVGGEEYVRRMLAEGTEFMKAPAVAEQQPPNAADGSAMPVPGGAVAPGGALAPLVSHPTASPMPPRRGDDGGGGGGGLPPHIAAALGGGGGGGNRRGSDQSTSSSEEERAAEHRRNQREQQQALFGGGAGGGPARPPPATNNNNMAQANHYQHQAGPPPPQPPMTVHQSSNNDGGGGGLPPHIAAAMAAMSSAASSASEVPPSAAANNNNFGGNHQGFQANFQAGQRAPTQQHQPQQHQQYQQQQPHYQQQPQQQQQQPQQAQQQPSSSIKSTGPPPKRPPPPARPPAPTAAVEPPPPPLQQPQQPQPEQQLAQAQPTAQQQLPAAPAATTTTIIEVVTQTTTLTTTTPPDPAGVGGEEVEKWPAPPPSIVMLPSLPSGMDITSEGAYLVQEPPPPANNDNEEELDLT